MVAVKTCEMKQIEKVTINQIGIPSIVLMENAAREFTKEILKDREVFSNEVIIFCGTGNNGGDGLAVARMLKQFNINPRVVILGSTDKLTIEAKINYNIVANLPIELVHIESELEFINYAEGIPENTIFVDAIFGLGCDRVIEGFYVPAIQFMNNSNQKIYAVDMPSGIHSDNGSIMGIAVNATKTITFAYPKIGLFLYPGAKFTGDLVIVDIGIPEKAIKDVDLSYEIIDEKFKELLPKRQIDSHKGDYGKVLIIAGSKKMMGAAILSAQAAYKSGCGIVKVLTEQGYESAVFASIPEAILETYHRDPEEFEKEMVKINEAIDWADAILLGPGMTDDIYTLKLLQEVLKREHKNLVIDADGLNVLSKNLGLLSGINQNIIITPHIGEMSRLTNFDVETIRINTVEFSSAFSKRYHVTTVLKSSRTIIAGKDKIFINILGNSGMATAGSGDVLSGIIVSILAQTNKTLKAAVLGTFIHSLSGDYMKSELGDHSLMARDIMNGISSVMR